MVCSSAFNFEKNGGKDEKRGGGLKISAPSLNILQLVSAAAWNDAGCRRATWPFLPLLSKQIKESSVRSCRSQGIHRPIDPAIKDGEGLQPYKPSSSMACV